MRKNDIIKAQHAFFDTGKTHELKYRMDALKRLLNATIVNEKKLLDALHADLGKSRFEGYMTELSQCREEIRFAIKHLPGWIKPCRVRTPLAHFASKSFIFPEPYGVALIISPWNYPVLLALEPLTGALAAGNCAILKPSRHSSATSEILSEMIEEIYPVEYIAVIQGSREENADLIELPFDYIFFTGSVPVGREIMAAASKNLTPVSLELGGKSPVIIDETADINQTAKRLAFGKFINAGQTCVAPDYVYVNKSRKEELIKALYRAITEFYPKGMHDENLPRIVNRRHFDRLMGLMAGEAAVIGGTGDCDTLKIAPTVLDNITPDSPVMQEEIFGPILPLMTYTDLDVAVRFIKSRPKPLALYLFSKDRSMQNNILRDISFGGGCINDTIVHLGSPHMGFGGVGESGMGAYHGKLSFDTFTHYKSILDKKTWIDLPLRYAPFSDKKEKLLRSVMK